MLSSSRTRAIAAACLLGLGSSSAAWPQAGQNGTPPPAAMVPPPPPSLSDLGKSLRGYFTDEELDILFQYMRDSFIATFKGEEVTLPADLAFKLEILLARMKKEGGHYMDNLIQRLEKDLQRTLKEKLTPPDTSVSPYSPPALLPPVPAQPPLPVQPAPDPQPGARYLPTGFPQPAFQMPATYNPPGWLPITGSAVVSYTPPALQPLSFQQQSPAPQGLKLPALPFLPFLFQPAGLTPDP